MGWKKYNEINEVMWRKCKLEMLRDPNCPKIAKDTSYALVEDQPIPGTAGSMFWCWVRNRKTDERLAQFPMMRDSL